MNPLLVCQGLLCLAAGVAVAGYLQYAMETGLGRSDGMVKCLLAFIVAIGFLALTL